MAPNSPACSFIHASMAGSRSTAPLNRSNSVLIVALLLSGSMVTLCAYLPSSKTFQDRMLVAAICVKRRLRDLRRPGHLNCLVKVVRSFVSQYHYRVHSH